MFQILNAKQDTMEQPATKPMPEEKTRSLVLRIEVLEERVAPAAVDYFAYGTGHGAGK